MDEKSQLELERILKLDPINLTPDEIGFLRARRGYLTSEDKRVFAIHVEDLTVKEEPQEDPVQEPQEDLVEEVKPQSKKK
jgi:hypothetical protein